MSENIIPQNPKRTKRRPAFTGVGISRYYIPVQVKPFYKEMHVTPEQFEVAVIWLDWVMQFNNPDRPRKLKTVLKRVGQRSAARKLIEKGILVKNGSGYVLAPECRKHIAYYRDREA